MEIRLKSVSTAVRTTGFLLLGCAAALILAGAHSPVADAHRAPSVKERKAIQKVALRHCRSQDRGCRRARVMISTVNSRYAFGGAQGMNFYGGALMRRWRGTWRVRGSQGGGIQACSSWRRIAPRKVLKDFRISGWKPGHSTGVPCWR